MGGSTADVMAEARGKREDAQLLREYEEFRQHGDDRRSGAEVRATYPDTLQFRRKDQNMPRAHPRPSPTTRRHGERLRGNPAAHPAQPPVWQRSPRDPEWIVEGGCGGEPPLEKTAPSPLAGEGG